MVKYSQQTIVSYLNELSSSRAVPGGGSATATIGALAASLSLMVARICMDKALPKNRQKLAHTIRQFEIAKKRCIHIIDRDPIVYARVAAVYALSKNQANRTQKIDSVLQEAYLVMKKLYVVIEKMTILNKAIRTFAKGAILGDLIISQSCLDVASRAAAETAMINVKCMNDKKLRKKCLDELIRVKRKV